MRGLPIARLATAIGWTQTEIATLEQFRDDLVDRVVKAAHP